MSKPLKETKTFKILKEISLEGRGLTNKELARRILGTTDSRREEYKRLADFVRKLEERRYLKTVGYEENPLESGLPRKEPYKDGKELPQACEEGSRVWPESPHLRAGTWKRPFG